MIFYNVFALFLSTVNANLSINCFHMVENCGFKFPKTPYINTVVVVHTGVSKFECMSLMRRFYWSVGIHCDPSLFCGLGFDDSRDYSSFQTNEIKPISEMCEVFLDPLRTNCEEFESDLYDFGIMKGK